MLYFGVVEAINDPKNSGRVKVRVLPFYRDLSTEDLPWAYVARSTDLGNTYGRGLNQHNLIEGSQVLVDFLDPNMQQPVVLFIVPRTSDFAEMQSYLTHTLKFLNGSEITVDETPGEEYIKVMDPQQNYILMNKDGITIHSGKEDERILLETAGSSIITTGKDTTIITEGDTAITTKGDTAIESSGDINITSDGDMNIEASGTLNIKSSGPTTIEGSKLSLKNIMGTGQLCSLPACLFTGAQHQTPNSD